MKKPKNDQEGTPETNPDSVGRPGLLNVILHGTFGATVRVNSLELITPKQADHQYYGGVPEEPFPAGLYPLGRDGTQYYLMGVAEGRSRSRFNSNTNGVMGGFVAMEKTAAFKVCLPMPMVVYSRRVSLGTNVFAGAQAHRFNGRDLALVQVLTYQFKDLSAVQFFPNIDWDPVEHFDPITQTVNLHLYAESEDFMEATRAQAHVTDAFQDLTAMFPGMEVKFVKPDTNPVPRDIYTGIPGVDSDDEKSLRELKWGDGTNNTPGMPKGTEPANCVGLTVELP